MTVSQTIPDPPKVPKHVADAAIKAAEEYPCDPGNIPMFFMGAKIALDVISEHLELWLVGSDTSVVPVYMWREGCVGEEKP